MSKRVLVLLTFLIAAGTEIIVSRPLAFAQNNSQPLTVRGQIWDSVCATAGSHGKVMAKSQVKDVKQCTLDCVKDGAQFVLYNSDDKTIYRLDTQDKVKEYAGQTVTVIGTYDRATDVLHVDRIETVM